MALVQLGNSLYRGGAFKAAEGCFWRALDHYVSLGDRRYQAEVKLSLGYAAYRLGKVGEALELATESRRLSQRSDLRASADELVSRLAAAI
jgi:tetratricopeptide (TPR) repeat protein